MARLLALGILVPLSVTACAPSNPGDAERHIERLRENTQFTYQDLRIGVAGIHFENGQLVAGLWFYLKDDPKLDRHDWVWQGTRIAIGNYAVEVVSVDGGTVEIEVTPQLAELSTGDLP